MAVLESSKINGTTVSMSIKGSTDSEMFKVYISELLCKSLHAGDIVIMDNLTSHKVSGIEDLIEVANDEL